jgi:serine/threonine protein kinase
MHACHEVMPQCMQVLVNIAKRLSSLHFDGWVHRDLKPGNVLWLTRKQRWTLIDFGLAARAGSEVAASFTPTYAAPEVVRAYKAGTTCIAQPSMDAWAMGVMAFELLTGKPAFDKFKGGAEKVCGLRCIELSVRLVVLMNML